LPGAHHAKATLDFHRRLRTDLVKVMSDFPYPKPAGKWWELREVRNPYPEQIRALAEIRDGLAGKAHFIETIFNPWNVAEKLSSKDEVRRLMKEKPQALRDALAVIAKSEANHARQAIETGASGVFVAVANAEEGVLTRAQYKEFSEPYDKMIFDAVSDAPLNTMHLHGNKVYLDLFYKGWAAKVWHYSEHGTGVPIADVRRRFDGIIMGGLDHSRLLKLSEAELRQQWKAARAAAGEKFILAPGCSAPNESKDEELLRIVRMVGA
ncbi:MAG: hypothetical protein GY953_36150, partial [bacterium]|nr:hypothetical protein [bacterium]